jgi:1-acyl-sn-glycerol-3-phosphate acyltransferase
MLRTLHTVIHTALFWTWIVVTLPLFFGPAFVIWLVTLPFDPNGRILHYYTCFWCGQHVWTNPLWRLDVKGRDVLDTSRPYVYASNHLSAGDIAVLFTLFLPFKFVSKHQNFWVPFIGWNMYLNRYVKLRRGDAASVREVVKSCKTWLGRGVSIMMFPEGTRSITGVMGPFKLGAFKLAQEAGVAVVPIVIDGTREALPKDCVLRQWGSSKIRVRVLAPVESTDYADPRLLADAVRAKMEEAQRDVWALRGFAPPQPAPAEAAPGAGARAPHTAPAPAESEQVQA